MTKKQINRFRRTDEQYYCTPCISANLPFCQLGSKKLCTLNCNDKILLPNSGKPWSPSSVEPPSSTCNLCMECNLECTGCLNNACIDTQRICETCDCKYADIEQFNNNSTNFKIWYKNTLSIMHVNTRSLSLKLSKITDILQSLDSPLDMLLISETKLIEGSGPDWKEEAIRKVNIPGYVFYPTFTNMAFGGTGIYMAEGLNCTRRDDLNILCDGCETTFMEVPTPGKQKNIIIGAIYRHPHENHESFFSSFYSIMENISQKFSVILFGDINIDVSPKVKCNHTIDYKNMLFSLGLRNMISKPTRITKESETIIDHIITNLPNEIIHSGILEADVADHLPIYALCSLNPSRKTSPSGVYHRNLTSAKKYTFVDAFRNEVESLYFDDCDDPDLYLQKIIESVTKTVDSVFPMVKRSKKHIKRFRKPWMTQGILNSIRTRHRLYHKYLLLKDENSYNKYTTYLNRLTRVKEQAQDFHYQKDFAECSGDPKLTWKKINNLQNKKKPQNKLPLIIKDGDSQIDDPKLIANKLNKNFVLKGPKLASKLPPSNKSALENMMPRVNDSITNIILKTPAVRKRINELKTNKAAGYDNISAKMLKWLVDVIAPLLTQVFNKYLSIGKYPDLFKIAKVTALHKGGEKINCENYRPISVLPQLNQIFEKLIQDHLTEFFTKNNILTKNQYGFRKGHSTSHGITHLNEKVIEAFEKKACLCSPVH